MTFIAGLGLGPTAGGAMQLFRAEFSVASVAAMAAGCVMATGCARAWTPPADWTPAPKLVPYTVVALRVGEGKLPLQLAKAAEQAAALGQEPYVELTSRWCRACHWMDHGLSDPQLSRAFGGTYVIRVDVDLWEGRMEGTGLDYHTGPIPAFIALSEEGKPVGDWADARVWQSEIPRDAAPALAQFFHGQDWRTTMVGTR